MIKDKIGDFILTEESNRYIDTKTNLVVKAYGDCIHILKYENNNLIDEQTCSIYTGSYHWRNHEFEGICIANNNFKSNVKHKYQKGSIPDRFFKQVYYKTEDS